MGTEKTRRREIGSLEVAMTQAKVVAGTIITLREEGSVTNDGGTICIVPAWKWALEA